MNELARQLISLKGVQEGSMAPTAIFGTAGQLATHLDDRERVRIGMWPAISTEAPEVAMGLMTTLAFLLERWQDIRVYRLFAKLEGEAQDYQWSVAESQFGVDDWTLEQLDENVALWGSLAQVDGKWELTIEIENDMDDEEEVKAFTYTADDLPVLVNALPMVSNDIAALLEAGDALTEAYEDTEADETKITALLKDVFQWQTHLILALWGKDWSADDIEKALNELVDAAPQDDFGAWVVSSAVGHAMLPGYDLVAGEVSDFAMGVVRHFPDSSSDAIHISNALFGQGRVQESYELLEADVTDHPDSVSSWLTLARLYMRGNRPIDSAKSYQRAIEAKATNKILFLRYAVLLNAMDTNDVSFDTFVLIDPDDYEEDWLLWEAVEAYEGAIQLDPDDVSVLQRQILLLADLQDDDSVLEGFTTLLELDKDGEAVRTVTDSLYNLQDFKPIVDLLRTKIIQEPQRADLHISLAVVYLHDELEEEAIIELEKAQDLTADADTLADIARLLLTAADPEFETRLGEILSIVDAGNAISVEDADFLEEALENAPSLSEAYVALGKTYRLWGVQQDALETLMDGHDQLPQDPDIIETLAGVLWDSGEHDLAFDYLNKGVAANPHHVPLLALTGLYLFEDGQEDPARAYLARAEAIAPRNLALTRARRQIAEMIGKRAE